MANSSFDGFSVLIPTQNMLPYLKDCLYALQSNSRLENEIVVIDDGSTDGTSDWLITIEQADWFQPVRVQRRQARGCFSGWNDAAKLASKAWLMAWQDDMHALPNWDKNLMAWIRADPTKQYGIGIIEPYWGSYVQYDCGTTPDTFDEKKCVQYVNSISTHTTKKQVFAHSAISREDWWKVGGLDERYDPTTSGWPDFQQALHKLRPREWLIVNDSWTYHTRHGIEQNWRNKAIGERTWHERNLKLFYEKWGVHVGPEHEARLGHL